MTDDAFAPIKRVEEVVYYLCPICGTRFGTVDRAQAHIEKCRAATETLARGIQGRMVHAVDDRGEVLGVVSGISCYNMVYVNGCRLRRFSPNHVVIHDEEFGDFYPQDLRVIESMEEFRAVWDRFTEERDDCEYRRLLRLAGISEEGSQ